MASNEGRVLLVTNHHLCREGLASACREKALSRVRTAGGRDLTRQAAGVLGSKIGRWECQRAI